MTADSTETSGPLTGPAGPPRKSPLPFPPPRTAADPGAARRRPRRGPSVRAALVSDCLAMTAALTLVASETTTLPPTALAAGLLAVLALNRQAGLYRSRPSPSGLDEVPALFASAALAWAVTAALAASADPEHAMALPALLSLLTLHTVLATAGRSATYRLRRVRGRRRPRSTLIVGLGPTSRTLAAALLARPEYAMRPVGLVACGPGEQHVGEPPRLPVLRTSEDVTRAVIQNSVRDAVLTRPPAGPELAALVDHLASLGCAVWCVGGPQLPAARPAGQLWGFACSRILPPPARTPAHTGKRAFDMASSGLALLLLSPLLALCALAVRLSDGPGVLFRQERVGRDGRPFTVLKFRTLRPTDPYEAATRWSVADDRRMSAVGHWMRRTSLDELPQLWNVLRGDMSLVGPRPERPFFVARFSEVHPHYGARHRMPVGITGLAQVHGLRGDTSIEDRARFDNHYIDTWSPWLDMSILLRTVGSVFRQGGS
ncbi:exopolysaccharide biosynthesis polyprenyl glycosylphosphotransferase [Streptomyces sp. P38-E01]|uniref:Exopolysaccharide biosynthesis polyprenyl glycosylphosphotransferase n=1 Tax=Streptomyces tardus TaxID=2780544 RepID=A0A949JI05_9ACTN|nr:exopolysaccharide biosynthesis polyprenyl glycosylphosphotransferase [Streptomyces tardus]MBU7599832.1 exopolysaccharide biosynthesis polyprenyl glycosylphosphotransferase [Streptomyces tardus]